MRIVLGLILLAVVSTPAAAGPKKPKPSSASVVFVIDRSGSMQGPRFEAAKEAVLAGLDALDATDRASLIIFDSEAEVVFENLVKTKRALMTKLVEAMQTGGRTNAVPALARAFKTVAQAKQTRKHIIVLTDGESPTDGIETLLADIRKAGVTVSAVGVMGADRNLLALIADGGRGRLYMVEDESAVGKIFVTELRELKR